MGKGTPCSPNCGQVIINNGGGTVIININCCRDGSWSPCNELETEEEEELEAESDSEQKESLKKWPLWPKEEL